jgi:hypothetical protein
MTDFKERNTPEKKVQRMRKATRQVTGSYQEVYSYRTNRYIEDIVPISIWHLGCIIIHVYGDGFLSLAS